MLAGCLDDAGAAGIIQTFCCREPKKAPITTNDCIKNHMYDIHTDVHMCIREHLRTHMYICMYIYISISNPERNTEAAPNYAHIRPPQSQANISSATLRGLRGGTWVSATTYHWACRDLRHVIKTTAVLIEPGTTPDPNSSGGGTRRRGSIGLHLQADWT